MEDTPDPQKVKIAIQKKPTAPASSQVKVIAAATASATSIPVPDVAIESESVDFGDGDDFGGGWGDDIGIGTGGGAKFFDQEVKAERVAFVIDYSRSMAGERDKLMRAELSKSIKGLATGTKYQIILFSGPAWVAGDKVAQESAGGKSDNGSAVVTTPSGDTYKWSGKGWHEWRSRGNKRPVEWIERTGDNITKSLEDIKKTPLSGGTDWESPMEMAMEMEPPPQVIFFMTDGAMGTKSLNSLVSRLASKAKRSDTIVNSVAMMEPKVAEAMGDLATKTGGQFTIVEKGGKVRQVIKDKK